MYCSIIAEIVRPKLAVHVVQTIALRLPNGNYLVQNFGELSSRHVHSCVELAPLSSSTEQVR